jgi:hypothetical protein
MRLGFWDLDWEIPNGKGEWEMGIGIGNAKYYRKGFLSQETEETLEFGVQDEVRSYYCLKNSIPLFQQINITNHKSRINLSTQNKLVGN